MSTHVRSLIYANRVEHIKLVKITRSQHVLKEYAEHNFYLRFDTATITHRFMSNSLREHEKEVKLAW